MVTKVWNGSRAGTAAAVAAFSLALTACGGGDQENDYRASRVFAFGDESSVINADGSKYTINALVSGTSTLDCSGNPIWVQAVASHYGLVFPQCNPNAVAAPASRIYAAAGATAADLAAQIDRQVAAGGFNGDDLSTLYVGSNDVLAAYRQFPAVAEAQLVASVEQAGATVAAQVNRIAQAGGKVLVSTLFSLNLTPFGIAEQAANPGRAGLLARLTDRFNAALRANIINDGRRIGLVLLDQYVLTVARSDVNAYANFTQAACQPSAPLPTCTTATLVTDASGNAANASTWLWADSLRLSAGGQANFGSIAVGRAANNPF